MEVSALFSIRPSDEESERESKWREWIGRAITSPNLQIYRTIASNQNNTMKAFIMNSLRINFQQISWLTNSTKDVSWQNLIELSIDMHYFDLKLNLSVIFIAISQHIVIRIFWVIRFSLRVFFHSLDLIFIQCVWRTLNNCCTLFTICDHLLQLLTVEGVAPFLNLQFWLLDDKLWGDVPICRPICHGIISNTFIIFSEMKSFSKGLEFLSKIVF